MYTSEASLARVPLLADLGPDELGRLAEHTRRETWASGATVVEFGTPGRSLYIVLEGELQAVYPSVNGDFELARLGPGDFFGEMALLNEKPPSASVRTLSTVEALVLDKEDFRRVVSQTTGMALKLLTSLSTRIRNTHRQIGSLSDQAVWDPLTGLLNQRAFHERLDEELGRHRRYDISFSLVLLDVDRLGAINERLGRGTGDQVLAWVGRVIQEHTRSADTAFRIGGEEFAVLCAATDPEQARRAADRLVSVVGEATPPGGGGLRVTLSAGYASCPVHATELMDLFEVADAALLRAKAAGRNRVAGPEEAPGG
ncbi:MAG: GGDEF domain-containing protein [Gemmatimonadota bacterium]|jgi:diguanylate cyclase (GGDEF)-like protein